MSIYPEGHRTGIQKHGGPSSGTPQPDWTVADDGRGVLSGTLKFFYDYATGKAGTVSVPARGDRHPYDERLVCNEVNTTYGSNDIAYCDASYVGLKEDPSGIEWTLSCPTEEDPIQVHPCFPLKTGVDGSFGIVQETAETSKTGKIIWVDGAVVTTEKGDFEKFGTSDDMVKKELVGVTSYKVPRATISITLHTANQKMLFEAIQNVGKTYDKPPFAPDWCGGTGGSWLYTSLSVTEYATIYKLQTEYMLSGFNEKGERRPWNKLIYKSAGSK